MTLLNFIKYYNYFSFFLFLLIFSGCKKSKIFSYKLNKKLQPLTLNNETFKLRIQGIECTICARKIVKKLESIENIIKAEFISSDKNFNDCYSLVTLKDKSKNINFNSINKELSNEGFILEYVEGDFLGIYYINEKNDFFKLLDSGQSFKVKSIKGNMPKANEPVSLKARLGVNKDKNVNFMII